MCGLFGYFGDYSITNDDVGHLHELATLSTLRGTDSTGYLQGRQHKRDLIFNSRHTLENAVHLFTDGGASLAFKGSNTRLVMGHCRAATLGKVTLDNAHPIREGNIIGCHNGTIPIFAPDKGDEEKNSDSRELFKRINDKGVEQAVAESGASGAYAMTWVHLGTKVLSFLRNKERTLYYIMNAHKTKMFWASEWRFLKFAVPTWEKAWETNPSILEVDELITIDMDDGLRSFEKKKITVPRSISTHYFDPAINSSFFEELEKLEAETVAEAQALELTEENVTSVPLITKSQDLGLTKVLEKDPNLPAFYRGFRNIFQATGYYTQLLKKKGCAHCKQHHTVKDALTWIDHDEYICENCMADDFIISYMHDADSYKGELAASCSLK